MYTLSKAHFSLIAFMKFLATLEIVPQFSIIEDESSFLLVCEDDEFMLDLWEAMSADSFVF